jgi:hypothetical protein
VIAVETLVAIAIVCYAVKALVADSAYAVRGQLPPRVRMRMKAIENGVTRGGQYGLSGYLADLWHDAWVDARNRRETKRASQTDTGTQRSPGMRDFLARRWEEAWESAEAKHQERRAAKRAADADTEGNSLVDRPLGAGQNNGPSASAYRCPHCAAETLGPAAEPAEITVSAAPATKGRRPAEYDLYDGQPFTDSTGIPDDLESECGLNGCEGTQRPIPGTQHFDADGGAMVDTACDRNCGVQSARYWKWTDRPPAENEDHFEPDEALDDAANPESGYSNCACRDCFDVTVSGDVTKPELCGLCEDAGCEPNDGDCQRDDAYGAGDRDSDNPQTPAPGLASVIPIRFTTEEEPEMGHTITTPPAEITGLTTAQQYAEGMKNAYQEAASGVELFTASLEGHGVSGEAVAAARRAAEMQQAAAAAWADAHAALDQQTGIREAYAAAPGAGTREFVTSE